MVELLLAIALTSSEPARTGFDHHAFCNQLQDFASSADAKPGRSLGADTRNGGVFVYCERRAVELKTLLEMPLHDAAGWIEVQKAIWRNDHCADEITRTALRNGWTLTAVIVDQDGDEVSFQAICEGTSGN